MVQPGLWRLGGLKQRMGLDDLISIWTADNGNEGIVVVQSGVVIYLVIMEVFKQEFFFYHIL